MTVSLAPSPFAPSLPTFQTAWDSTSLGLFKECPRKYYYEIILGWRPKHTSVHLTFGLLYHAGLEAYDHFAASLGKLRTALLTDDEHRAGIRVCLRRVLADAGERDEAGLWHPWRSEDPYKNIWTLCRSLVWYLDHFRISTLETLLLSNGRPAVELSFRFPIFHVAGEEILLCGHMDRVVKNLADADRRSVHDRKTTKSALNNRFFNSFSPHNQFTIYTIASNVVFETSALGVTVDAAQTLVNSTNFAQRYSGRSTQVLDEWLGDAKLWIEQAARYAEANHFPQNDKSCGNYGGCAFIEVCSKAPSFRQAWLEQDFKPFTWNPLQSRGDI
jgi:hypothetical protein